MQIAKKIERPLKLYYYNKSIMDRWIGPL